MRFDDAALPSLEEVLAKRMHATGTGSTDYIATVMPTPEEQAELARHLSVGETYFLRNRDQFLAFQHLVRARAESGLRYLRLLSAGCASGEEAYSLAITLLDVLPELAAWDISITAFDLNPAALERARRARYRSWALRETPPEVQRRYFQATGDEFLLADAVRRMVRVEQRNLVDADPAQWRPESFDIVFCRNVLMYFTPEAARGAVARIARSLATGGHLFLGHAETLRGLSNDFHLCHTHSTFYYRKRGEGGPEPEPEAESIAVPEPATPPDASWFDIIADSTSRIRDLGKQSAAEDASLPADSNSSAMEHWKAERFHEALEALADSADDADSLLLRAMAHLSKGELEPCLAACKRLLAHDDLNAGAHHVEALCFEHVGNLHEAAKHDRIASYLDPVFAMPRLHLGLLARRAGDLDGARRELQAARNLLAAEDTARIVLCDGQLASLEDAQ
jgi:chemotaxis protein methyltransferase CheR